MTRRRSSGFGLIALVLGAALVAVLAYTVLVTYFGAGTPVAGAAASSQSRQSGSAYVNIVAETAAGIEAAERLHQQEIQKILHAE